MAYKRYIKKDGKTYGPYFYESKKLDGKVISNYVGKGSVKKNSFSSLRKNFVFVFGFFLLSLFIVFMTTNLTGNVALSVEDSYISGENLEGVIKLSLEQGEFIPSSTLILVNNSGEIFEYYLSDLISETPEEGIYSLEGINLSGSGEGFGVEDISYPTVFFSLEIFEEAVNETIVGEVEVPETVEPEAPVEENVTEEVPETNITEEINETEITNETVVEEINETVEESEEEINESSDEIVEIVGESEVPAEELQEETSEQLVEVLVEGETTEESSVESSSDSSSESSESDSDESSSESESSDSGSESESESSSEESSDSSSESSDSGDSSSESSDSSSESSESSSDSGGSESSESGITGQIIGAMFNFFSLTGNVVSSEVELSVDYNETVRYNLSEGQSAEIKSGSVRTSEKDLEDSDVVLIQKTGYVEATTFYSEGQSKTYEINLTDLNLSAREGILSIGLSYNGTEILQEEKAILVQENETLVNQTLNETLVPINVTNVTSVNVSNVSVSVNTTQFSVVINRPVKWKKRVEVNKTDGVQNISIELPKEAMNISVYKIVDRELNGEKEVLVEEGVVVTNETFSEGIEESVIIEENVSEIEGNESVEEVNATEVLEPVPSVEIIESSEENLSETDVRIGLTGNVIVGQVSLEIDTDKEERSLIADFFKKIFSALTGRVVEITEEESVKEVIIETDETENETEIEIEYETPGPTSTEVVLNGDKRVIVNSSLHYENVLAYTVMEGGAGEDYVIYWEENKTFLPIYYQDTDGVDRYIEWVIPHLSTQTFTVQKVEETCADWINGTHNQTECSGDGIVLEKMLSMGEIKKLTASDAEDNDRFGESVSISSDGTTVIVGAYNESGTGSDIGAAYIYKNESGGWTETKLNASDAEDNDRFGESVSISSDGTTVIVGANGEDGAGSNRGAAYIYKNESGGWTETKLNASDAEDGDEFGFSVSISSDGTTVIVGAYAEDGAGDNRGAAYIYKNESGGWTETKLNASDAENSDFFGYSVSISSDGTKAIVGARWENGAGSKRGAAYIYKNESGGWTETKLTASDTGDDDNFGYSVSISSDGTTAIVGAFNEAGTGSGMGAAYIYKNESGGWTEIKKLNASDAENNDYFGISVSISSDGTTAIVGANGEDGAGSNRGAAYIYENESGGWTETKLTASDAENSDSFGSLVSISSDGTKIIIGAYNEDGAGSDRGAAYVFGEGAFGDYYSSGDYVSQVLDAGENVNWSGLEWNGTLPGSGGTTSVADNSLLFDGTDYLSWTPGSADDADNWTYSWWMKPSDVSTTNNMRILTARTASNTMEEVRIYYGEIVYFWRVSGVDKANIIWNSKLRDPSEWYHCLFTRDGTSVKFYVNGIEVTDTTVNTAVQSGTGLVNTNVAHYIGHNPDVGWEFDGYMNNANFIDGQALTPSSFGEYNSQGKWVPKEYSGTYGTNGFNLKFENASALGQDGSGNGNNWTENGFNATKHQVNDTPNDNYATLNPLDWHRGPGATLEEGNLNFTGGLELGSRASFAAQNSGKWYFEVILENVESNGPYFGVTNEDNTENWATCYAPSATFYSNGNSISSGTAYVDGDIASVLIDMDNRNLTFYRNGIYNGHVDIPESELVIPSIYWTGGAIFNFGATNFTYAPPEGYQALSSTNLPELSWTDASEYFNAVTYVGTGAERNVSCGFQPDMVWIKNRNQTDSHKIFDSVRGPTIYWESDTTDADTTDANSLTAFTSDGFTLGTGANGFNDNGENFVAWCWKESPEFGFDIVNGEHTDTGESHEHNLNKTPEFIVYNSNQSQNNFVYYDGMTLADYLLLNTNEAEASATDIWHILPNSTHFGFGDDVAPTNMTAYLFTSVDGFSKVGSYTGNGNVDGPFVYTGFKPKYVLVKRTDSAGAWIIIDTSRNPFNPLDKNIYPYLNNNESLITILDSLENGFKIRNNVNYLNNNGGNYIYIAFADYPLKDLDSSGSTNITMQTRTSSDNSSWSDWSSYSSGVINESVRYLQYKALLTTENTSLTPVLNWVNLSYEDIKWGITLNSPTEDNNSIDLSNAVFNCSVEDYEGNDLENVSIYSNLNGTWEILVTNSSISGSSGDFVFTRDLFSDKGLSSNFLDQGFNWSCYACDNESDCEFASENRSFSSWDLGTHNQTVVNGETIILSDEIISKELQKLTALDTQDYDFFGNAVSMSSDGTKVIVGASSEDGAGSNRGAAYIYKNESGGWTETKLTASDTANADSFGKSVSMSSDGTKVIIGASGEDGAGLNRGAAYIYKNESGGWTETKLTSSDTADYDLFGYSVSMSSDGTKVIVGAYAEDGAGSGLGAAYIYKNESGGWTETKLNASDAEDNDYFGYSVSMSSDGTKVIIGAYYEDGAGTKRGAAYVFSNSSGTWTEIKKLTASDAADNDYFGNAVSMSSDGTKVIVGAEGEDGVGSDSGAVYIYKNESGGWTEIKLNASDAASSEQFGRSVSISSDGTTAIVGAYLADEIGAAYVFSNSSGTWTEIKKLTASDSGSFDEFGFSVSMSSDGTTAIVGAEYDGAPGGTANGSAYVFEIETNYYSSGDYVSRVFDARSTANWSGLEWNGTLPGSGGTTSVAENSLLFDGTDYLSWTPGSADDADNWTYSWWMKPSDVSTANNMRILTARTASNTKEEIRLYQGEVFYFWGVSGVEKASIIWNSKLRDPSEWYHCLFTRDGTSVKFYVDGVEVTNINVYTAVSSGTGLINTNVAHYIGHNPDVSNEFDGYMNNVNFIDGQALTPSSFGEYNSQGKWVPKEYSGTYGTNGFNLKFENASALGQDGSGNGNNWTENGFNATKHQVNDTPNDNYATLNFLSTDSGVSLSEGNLYFSVPSATYQDRGSISTFEVDSGKWYFEAKYVSGNGVDLGIVDGITWNPGVRPSGNSTYLYADGSSQSIYKNSVFIENPGSVVVGDYIGIAFDVDNGSIQYYKNGVTLGAEITGVNYNSWTPYLFVSSGGTARGSDFIFNFGATNFTYAPPEGYQALSSTNLPDLSWTDASEYFNAVTYVGTGAEQDISCGFQPDMVWIKNRNQTDSHKIFDSVRGPTKYLESDTTDADTTDANSLTAFTSDGFTLGTGANGFNDNGEYFVAWCWKESPEFGFDIVNYTGTGVAHAEEHNLGVAPEMILDKVYEGGTYDWHVYNSELGGTYDLNLNSNIAAFTATVWNNLEPNSTHFNLGTLVGVNGADKNYTAYLFTSVDGFSKIGSYTGNGNADGPFVYTGFKPKYVMVKRTDSTGSWGVNVPDYQQGDNMRYWMFADKNNSQDANSQMDFLSNGFKIRATDSWSNANTGNYIYIAFADYPLKDLDSSGSTNITMQTRTSPDNSSWSDWSNYSSGVINESVRYLQYKALLTTENTSLTPVLNWVNLSYEAIKWGITLNTPEDNNNSIDLSNAVFNCSVENYLGNNLENVSIYSNLNGTWEILVTNSSISGSSGDFVFTRDLSSDKGLSSNFLDQGFNWSCYVCDNESDCEFASENRSFSSWDLGTHNQTVVSGAGVVLDLETTQGDVVESYAATNSDNDKLMRDGSTTGRGQAFTLSSSETIGYAGFYLKKVGTPVGDMVAKIYSVSGTVGTNAAPTGSALAVSSAINASSLGTSSEVINFTFTSPYSASAGNYAVVLEYYGGDASNYISMGHDVSSPAHSGNQVYNTTSWSGASDTDTIFYLYESSTVSSGDYVSQVFDSEDTVSWDSLVWKADVPLGLVNQTQKLTALDTENNDEFGNSVSISSDGTTAIVGAYLEDGAGLNRGAAYIYKNESGTWTETKLTASDATNSSNFGYSVSISSDGTTAIVGAYWEDGAGIDRGAAYIYKNESGGWTETKLTASDAADYDRFGESVSISSDGTTVIVGAKDEDGAGTDRGAAYIYKNESGGWTETKLTASDAAYSDKFGYSVSISSDGTTVIVGAKDEDGAGDTRGAAYIYKNESGGWTETKLTASDAEDWDYFGYSVSISSDGTTAIVGAYAEDGAGSARGAAYIYKNESGGWTETKLTASDATNSDYFGNSVSISSDGTTAIVGAYYEDGAGTDRGAAYIYKNESGGWIETKLNASDAADSDWFGYSVSISSDGTMVLVGASHENGAGSNRGAAYIFNGQTSLGFQTRTSSDNSSWSDWSSYSSGVVNSSTRYLQYKALLTTENTSLTPVLNWVNLSYSILVIPVADQFAIKNSIGNNVAIFDSEGNLFLKGTLSQSQSSLSAPANSFIINNNTGQTVAYVSSTGSMFLKGILSESQTSMSPGSSLQIRNSTDSIVAYIDKDGNLNLKGGAYENSANI